VDHIEALGGSKVGFGEQVKYSDGIRLAVSEPAQFIPSAKATVRTEKEYVKFTLELVNESRKEVSAADVFVMVESAGGQGGAVIDPNRQASSAPTRMLAPGDKITWTQGFGVLDPADVKVVVQAGLTRRPVEFSA
jgi:hypothetical protein